MNTRDKTNYWLRTAEHDWTAAKHLFEKGDYSYALFFGHLTIEKILKAIFSNRFNETPPFSHNLVYLAEKSGLELDDEKLELLEEISDYNLEARYPDEKLSFYQKCSKEFTEIKLREVKEIKKWLIQQM